MGRFSGDRGLKTSSLNPAFSPRRRSHARRVFGQNTGGIGRRVNSWNPCPACIRCLFLYTGSGVGGVKSGFSTILRFFARPTRFPANPSPFPVFQRASRSFQRPSRRSDALPGQFSPFHPRPTLFPMKSSGFPVFPTPFPMIPTRFPVVHRASRRNQRPSRSSNALPGFSVSASRSGRRPSRQNRTPSRSSNALPTCSVTLPDSSDGVPG